MLYVKYEEREHVFFTPLHVVSPQQDFKYKTIMLEKKKTLLPVISYVGPSFILMSLENTLKFG